MPRNKGVPHYQRLIDQLAEKSALQQPGHPVLSERAIALRYGVARNTARRALQELEKRGSVLRVQGSGTFRTALSTRLVLGYGYRLDHEPFSRYFRVLSQSLAVASLQLVVRDIGLTGERFTALTESPKLQQAEAVVIMASSHPEGLRAMTLFRRRFPKLLPLLLIGESLGLKLQGRHRFDFMHYDFRASATILVRNLLACGYQHPVFISRSDVTVFTALEAREGFCDELRAHALDPQAHCLAWDPGDANTLRKSEVLLGKRWRPDVFVVTHGYDEEFRSICLANGMHLPEGVAFASVGESRRHTLNTAEMARLSADLLLNRLAKPNRSNLHITLAIPEKFRRPF